MQSHPRALVVQLRHGPRLALPAWGKVGFGNLKKMGETPQIPLFMFPGAHVASGPAPLHRDLSGDAGPSPRAEPMGEQPEAQDVGCVVRRCR